MVAYPAVACHVVETLVVAYRLEVRFAFAAAVAIADLLSVAVADRREEPLVVVLDADMSQYPAAVTPAVVVVTLAVAGVSLVAAEILAVVVVTLEVAVTSVAVVPAVVFVVVFAS